MYINMKGKCAAYNEQPILSSTVCCIYRTHINCYSTSKYSVSTSVSARIIFNQIQCTVYIGPINY